MLLAVMSLCMERGFPHPNGRVQTWSQEEALISPQGFRWCGHMADGRHPEANWLSHGVSMRVRGSRVQRLDVPLGIYGYCLFEQPKQRVQKVKGSQELDLFQGCAQAQWDRLVMRVTLELMTSLGAELAAVWDGPAQHAVAHLSSHPSVSSRIG